MGIFHQEVRGSSIHYYSPSLGLDERSSNHQPFGDQQIYQGTLPGQEKATFMSVEKPEEQ